jgi:gamma-glutamyl-gamma-aminobutyrate hydrolase PuuD
MQHSIKEIAKRYSEISKRRNDRKQFNQEDFIQFASNNQHKYNLEKVGNDLFVSTLDSDDLINDYRKTIK